MIIYDNKIQRVAWSDKKLWHKSLFYKVWQNAIEVQLMVKTWITTKYRAYKW